jgi:DNA-binding transcriptional regulator YdaS (Cro superfamily)
MRSRIKRDPGIEHAIEAAGGTIKALSAQIGVSRTAIAGWQRVPAERVLEIENAVAGTDRRVMRPDLYGDVLASFTEAAPITPEGQKVLDDWVKHLKGGDK